MLNHLDGLDADFRVFYRIDGIADGIFPASLTAPRFLALAHRTGAYEGVMAARIAEADREDQPAGNGAQAPAQRAAGVEQVESTPAVLKAHPGLAGLIEF